MPDKADDLVLAYLRRIDAKASALREDIVDLKQRTSALEVTVASLAATHMRHYASLATRLDRVEQRLERLERHLDTMPA